MHKWNPAKTKRRPTRRPLQNARTCDEFHHDSTKLAKLWKTFGRIMVQWHKTVAIFLPSVVEFVCTMFFVLIGCGSTIAWPQEEAGPNVVSISLCFGFSYAFLLNISTCFSGGFFNPAMTAALVVNKTLSVTRAFCYILAQVLGGKRTCK